MSRGGFGGGGFGGLPFGAFRFTPYFVNVGDTVPISEVIIVTHPQGGGGYGGMSYGGGPWGGFDLGTEITINLSDSVSLSEAITISTVLFTFVPAAVSSTKVRLTFETALRVNAALTDPTSYTILDAALNPVPVAFVIVEGDPLFPTAVSLVLGVDLVSSALYDVRVGPGVVTSIGSRIFPDTKPFQWFKASQEMVVRFKDLSGEVQGGLFGVPEGLVFFSPSLTTSAPNSIIQIDDVSVCTRAYDTYTFPSPPDPSPLFTFSPLVTAGTLNGPAVLFAPWDRLTQAQFNFGSLEQDMMLPAFDGQVSMTFRQPFDPNFVALLNDPAWVTFPASALTVSLDAYWKADGNGLDSSSTHSQPLTVTGGLGFATGILGQAFNFVGNPAQSAVRPVSDADFQLGGNFTVQCWVKLNSVPAVGYVVIDKFDHVASTAGWILGAATLTPTTFQIAFQALGNAAVFGGSFGTGTWHHLVARGNGAVAVDIFLDGFQVGTSGGPTPISPFTTPLGIGDYSTAPFSAIDGLVDEVAVWGRALTDPEIAQLYNFGAALALTTTSPFIAANNFDLQISYLGAYWKGDGNGLDSSPGKAHPLVLTGGLGFAPGLLGQAFNFVGNAAQTAVRTVEDSDLELTGVFTFQCWVNVTSIPAFGYILLDKFDHTLTVIGGWIFGVQQISPTQVQPVFSVLGVGAVFGGSFGTGSWHHVVFRNDPLVGMDLFVDGVLTASSGGPIAVAPAVGFPAGMGDYTVFPFQAPDALVDEVAVWNRLLSNLEITQLYNGGAGLPLGTFHVPAGPTTILILGAPMIGDSDMADDAHVLYGAVANPVGTASTTFAAS